MDKILYLPLEGRRYIMGVDPAVDNHEVIVGEYLSYKGEPTPSYKGRGFYHLFGRVYTDLFGSIIFTKDYLKALLIMYNVATDKLDNMKMIHVTCKCKSKYHVDGYCNILFNNTPTKVEGDSFTFDIPYTDDYLVRLNTLIHPSQFSSIIINII